MGLASRPTHRALIRVKAPNDVDIAVSASGRGGWRTESNGDSIGPRIYQVPLIPDPGANSINLDVWIADGPWTTLTTMAPHQGGNVVFSAMSVGSFEVTMTPMIDQNGKAQIFISTTKTEGPKRVSAIGNDGKAYAGRSMGWAKTTALETQGFTFDLAAARIKSVMIQERDYNWHIVAQNVTLDASHPTAAKILVNPK
jgi:hypothetical protein